MFKKIFFKVLPDTFNRDVVLQRRDVRLNKSIIMQSQLILLK